MSTVAGTFTYIVKHPGKRAEPVTLAEGVKFMDEIYRVIESAEGNPRGGRGPWAIDPIPNSSASPTSASSSTMSSATRT